MPEKTAANIFIENGVSGKPLTPYKHSMHRPMLYVDIDDVSVAYEKLASMILQNNLKKPGNSVEHIFNVYYPEPITIIELANITKEAIIKLSNRKIQPVINIVNTGQPSMFNEEDKKMIKVDAAKALNFLKMDHLKSPSESMDTLVKERLNRH